MCAQSLPSRSGPVLKHDLGGTTRQCTASQTLSRVRPLLPAFGITRLANITGLDRIGVEVWVCIRPNGRCLSVSLGKGVTRELAQVSAIMESIEVHHAERCAEPEIIATARAAARRCAIVEPETLGPGIRWSSYSRSRAIGWSRGADLASGEPVLVPHARVDLHWSRVHPDAGLFATSTTGLASGNHRLEALAHAMCEVIERDAEWRFQRMSEAERTARQVDLTSVDVPALREILAGIAAEGFDVVVWDITSPVGVPAYRCSLNDPRTLAGLNPASGYGCHPSRAIALSRAVTEAVQCRVGTIAGSRDDLFHELYEAARLTGPREETPAGTLDFATRRSLPAGTSFEDDLRAIRRRLRAAGFPRVLVVDHTRPEFGIPVVFVVVPGMREVD